MISSLRGLLFKHEHPWVTIDVAGVGYAVQCTANVWEQSAEGSEVSLHIYTFVREDRLELFGFSSTSERTLFTHFLAIPGIGPRTALNLSAVPMDLLLDAVQQEDTRILGSIKGIGKKMAEKLLVELSSLAEKGILVSSGAPSNVHASLADQDALEALVNLGYDRRTVLQKLRELPKDVEKTEDRVRGVLQALS